MLKVLLVDDEILVRAGIKMMFDWPGNGFEIVGEAANGVQALKMYEDYQPDLIITDMRMPQMDGAAFIKTLKQRNAKVKILVLSCYDDFNYMKEALNYGAFDYILKPEMTQETIAEVIKRIKARIVEDLEREKEYHDLKRQVALSSYLAKEKMLRDLIYGNIRRPEDFPAELDSHHLEFPESYFSVAVISVDHDRSLQNATDPKRWQALKVSLFNIIQGIVNSSSSGTVLANDLAPNYIAVFNGSREQVCGDTIYQVAQNMIRAVSTYTKLSISIGISETGEDLFSINRLYQQATEAVRHKIFNGASVFDYSRLKNVVPDNEQSKAIVAALQEVMFTITKDGKEEPISESLDKVFEMVLQSQSMPILDLIWMEFVGWINKQITELTTHGEHTENLNYLSLEDLNGYDDVAELKLSLQHQILRLIHRQSGDPAIHYSKTIKKALEFIKANYQKNIKLTDVSSHVNISKSYLSVLFRAETGHNFIDYLTDYRIEMAKRKLAQEDLKMYEVSSRVGFENERYFSQIFRNKTGMTPTEYKKFIAE